ncbi:ABC transporter substrate-binding protein [Pseudomonas moorei]|nr:ABC transporter substrate-binding protein [Pseudomonas moorei]
MAGPPSVVSFPLFRMIEERALEAQATNVRFQLWQNGEQLRALLLSGQVDFSAAPSHVPANLYNRGLPVRLLTVSAWGVHWLVSRDPNVHSFEDLRGKELVVPLRHDMPGILIDRLLLAHRWEAGRDLVIRTARDFPSAVNQLLSGQADNALLVEPSVSVLLARNSEQPGAAPLFRVQSMQTLWAASFPTQPQLPQAGLMAAGEVVLDSALLNRVAQAYQRASMWCQEQRYECAELAHRYLPHLSVEALEQSIENSPLDARPAADVQPQLQAFYQLLLAQTPELIDGRVPDAGLYTR